MGQISTRIDPREMLPPYGMQEERFDVPDTNVGEMIYKQTALDALKAQKEAIENSIQHMIGDNSREVAQRNQVVFDMDIIQNLPPAQPVQLQPWQVMAAQAMLAPHKLYEDGTLWVTVDDVSKVSRVIVDEGKSKFCKTFYQDAQPAFGEIKHAGLEHPLADSEIIPRLREIQSLIPGGSYAIDRAIELIQAQPGFTTMTVGRTKGETTMWYECAECGEPVDQKDNFCRNCGRRFKKDG